MNNHTRYKILDQLKIIAALTAIAFCLIYLFNFFAIERISLVALHLMVYITFIYFVINAFLMKLTFLDLIPVLFGAVLLFFIAWYIDGMEIFGPYVQACGECFGTSFKK